MKAVVQETCTCGLEVRESIWLCQSCHTYRKGKQQFTSVSRVIKTLLPADYSDVDSTVLECARLRGQFVDTYFSEWLADPSAVLSPAAIKEIIAPLFPRDGYKHADDVEARIGRLLDWWTASGRKATAIQQTVYSEAEGIAGTFDLATDDLILDLKCVSSLQPNYRLQLGAYLALDGQKFPLRDAAILHVKKDKVKLVPFNGKQCKEQWRNCLAWYRTVQELAA